MRRKILSIIISASLCFCNAYAADATGWDTIYLAPQSQETPNYNIYHNSRFGYSVAFPNYFSQSGEMPGNGDGISMAGDDALLSISGMHNALEETPQDQLKYAGSNRYAEEITENSLRYYSDEGNRELFCYQWVGDIIISIYIEYPKEQHEKYIEIIDYMIESIEI